MLFYKLWDRNYRDNVSLIATTAFVDGQSYNVLLNEPVAIKALDSQELNLWSSGFEWSRNVFMTTYSNY